VLVGFPEGYQKSIRLCSDCNCGVELAEYHVGLHLLLCLADAEIRVGAAGNSPAAPAAAIEFEWKLRELGLTNETCVSSVQLRTWCAENKNHRYIPEWLLKAWQMQVDPDLSSAA
jgi:hypothetical protein